MLVAPENGEEEITLNAHCLCALDESDFAVPVNLFCGLFRTGSGAIDDSVDAYESCW